MIDPLEKGKPLWTLLFGSATVDSEVDLSCVGSTALCRGHRVDELRCRSGGECTDHDDRERVLFELALDLGNSLVHVGSFLHYTRCNLCEIFQTIL